MKLLNRQEFLNTPKDVVYALEHENYFFGLYCKTSDKEDIDIDFYTQHLLVDNCYSDNLEVLPDDELKLNYEVVQRDGLFEENQKFLVYEKKDLEDLINYLTKIKDNYETI